MSFKTNLKEDMAYVVQGQSKYSSGSVSEANPKKRSPNLTDAEILLQITDTRLTIQ